MGVALFSTPRDEIEKQVEEQFRTCTKQFQNEVSHGNCLTPSQLARSFYDEDGREKTGNVKESDGR
jgi:hypothetical protein